MELPDRAEVALERAAARGLHESERLVEVDVVVIGVVLDEVASRERIVVEVLSRRRALTVEMIHKVGEAWKIPADLLVRPYKTERAA